MLRHLPLLTDHAKLDSLHQRVNIDRVVQHDAVVIGRRLQRVGEDCQPLQPFFILIHQRFQRVRVIVGLIAAQRGIVRTVRSVELQEMVNAVSMRLTDDDEEGKATLTPGPAGLLLRRNTAAAKRKAAVPRVRDMVPISCDPLALHS